MSREAFNDDCEGCRPVALDPRTGKPWPAGSAPMLAIERVWAKTTLPTRAAFHRVTCLNSRDPEDLRTVQRILEALEKELPAKG